jgi:hypothetical protein
MPAIASLEDLEAAPKRKLLSPQSLLLITKKKWLEERTPEQLKGEGGYWMV